MPTLLISTSVDRVQAPRPRLALVTGHDVCWAKRAARRAGIAPGYCPGCRPGPAARGAAARDMANGAFAHARHPSELHQQLWAARVSNPARRIKSRTGG